MEEVILPKTVRKCDVLLNEISLVWESESESDIETEHSAVRCSTKCVFSLMDIFEINLKMFLSQKQMLSYENMNRQLK